MFVKFTSIENSYRTKYIDGFLQLDPTIANERFVVTEKVDGSNFQWEFSPEGDVRCGSRNNYLDMSGSFQGAVIRDLYAAHAVVLDKLIKLAIQTDSTIRLYGELYGEGIQKRVDYGRGKKLIYFAMMINGDWLCFREFQERIANAGGGQWIVPILFIADGLNEALETDIEFNTLLNNKENNLAEGVVISMYDRVVTDGHGSPFILKKKHEQFGEGKVKEAKAVDATVLALNASFREYINENRILSVFSKEGVISSPKEIGKYIKLIMDDAREDFEKDFNLSTLDKNQLKGVYNVGSVLAVALKEYM